MYVGGKEMVIVCIGPNSKWATVHGPLLGVQKSATQNRALNKKRPQNRGCKKAPSKKDSQKQQGSVANFLVIAHEFWVWARMRTIAVIVYMLPVGELPCEWMLLAAVRARGQRIRAHQWMRAQVWMECYCVREEFVQGMEFPTSKGWRTRC